MYSFEPDDEQKMLIDAVQRFAFNDLRPAARDADETGHMPESVIEKGWELGLLQASIPEEFGGFGEHSAVTGVLAAEELAWGDLAGALAVMLPGLFALPILVSGTPEQKQKFLPEVIGGAWTPFSAALVEPRFDFDPNQLTTEAIESGDTYILKGQKVFVPYAQESPAFIVYARYDGRTQGFIVPAQTPGLEIGDRQLLMGINAFPVYRVDLNDVKVPGENRLGGNEGHDFAPIVHAMWIATATLGVGVSRAAFEYARDYAKEREAFGVKIAQKQAIAFMLAEMATEIEAIRLLTWKAAWMFDRGLPEAGKLAYLAFTGSMDMAMMVTDRAVQILGGHGYIREHPVEMWMRCGRGIATFTGLAMV